MSIERAPLADRTIVTTRDRPGELDTALRACGARVVPLALIRIVDLDIAALTDALTSRVQWLVVTSRHGARLAGPVAATLPGIRLAAVGRRTAEILARGARRPVELVPDEQHALGLVALFADQPAPAEIVIAQGDLAEPTLVEGLERLGHHVRPIVVYRTEPRYPHGPELAAVIDADAVVLMSGSAARVWSEIAAGSPALAARPLCAIGPTTATAAHRAGLRIDMVAEHHSVDGVVQALIDHLGRHGD